MSDGRYINAIFCEDIRHEVGNKHSFMGCFDKELILPSFPAFINKISIAVICSTPLDNIFKSLVVRVTLDDEIIGETEFPEDTLQKMVEEVKAENYPNNLVGIKVFANFSPMLFERPSNLDVIAICETGKIVGPRLLVRSYDENNDSSLKNYFLT